ncbi:hypothetical protein [Amorphus sp. 3PC139-8]|uniref:hypothetical protein n=1 Tax=Amorphus sp. 3PC139-8 TaxID=2735676 RepID=UPI00345D937D
MTNLRRGRFAAALAVAQYGHRLSDGLKTFARAPHRPHLVATTPELADMARRLAGSRADVSQASAHDLLALARADIVLFPKASVSHAETAVVARFATVLSCSTNPADLEETLGQIRDALIALDRDGEFDYRERFDLAAVERPTV